MSSRTMYIRVSVHKSAQSIDKCQAIVAVLKVRYTVAMQRVQIYTVTFG